MLVSTFTWTHRGKPWTLSSLVSQDLNQGPPYYMARMLISTVVHSLI